MQDDEKNYIKISKMQKVKKRAVGESSAIFFEKSKYSEK